MAVDLDEVDVRLLTALQEDADRTNVELARLTGLSPAATLHRVRALKESGVIRIIRAHVDPAAAEDFHRGRGEFVADQDFGHEITH